MVQYSASHHNVSHMLHCISILRSGLSWLPVSILRWRMHWPNQSQERGTCILHNHAHNVYMYMYMLRYELNQRFNTQNVFFLLPSDWVFQGGCVLRKFASICSPLAVVEEKVLQLSQKTVLVMGKAKYDSQETIHTLCEHTTNSTLCLSCIHT